ncbi:hypothetical protein FNF29_05347 [Cafeteria roenbergensis]|uniref:Uncharacterized protein n=1 Tax=Cafeteria roenbergensis TaxID=33653 RepID=A0A5A8CBN3_CAFRO|nr:hypothetical protein FNF29_05347 [Cafeteria roenbergensis]|eukprot:KAA0150335.1 hypothetical protein FNF29_05347 [Cafeteria roenbergensis]
MAERSRGGEGSEAGDADVGPSDSASQAGAGPVATEEQLREMVAGPLQALRMLLSTGLNPNGRSGTLLRAPLHSAAEAGQPEVVSVLLQSGAVVDVVDANGWTPLAVAVLAGTTPSAASPGHMECARRLLAAGASVGATTSMRRTALHLAAVMQGAPHGHIATIRLLVRHDAERGELKRRLDSAGRSPLDCAKTPAARAALDTLWEAAAAGRLDATQRMLRVASRVDPGVSAPWQPVQVWDRTRDLDRTAFHAVVCGAAAAVSSLRDSARKAALSSSGAMAASRSRGRGASTPGAVAAARRMRNVIAGIGLQGNAHGGVSHPKALPATASGTLRRRGSARQKAAAQAEQEAEEPFARVAALLLSNGADPDAADADGVTALMLAARFGLCLVCRAILPKVSLSVADAAGNTALHWAQAFGQVAVADLLLDEGADPSVPNANGESADDVIGAGMALVSPTSAEAMLARAPQRPTESASLKATLLRDSLRGSGAALRPKA